MERLIDIKALAKYFLRRIWIIILCAAIGYGAFYHYTAWKEVPVYTATTTVYIMANNYVQPSQGYSKNPTGEDERLGYFSTSEIYASTLLVNTYDYILRSSAVMSEVSKKLDGRCSPAQIRSSLSIQAVPDTQFMTISSTTADPQLSADICNTLAGMAEESIQRIIRASRAEPLDEASVPTSPKGSAAQGMGKRGALIFALIPLIILAILFFMDDTIKDEEDFKNHYGSPVLGTIPDIYADNRNEKYRRKSNYEYYAS